MGFTGRCDLLAGHIGEGPADDATVRVRLGPDSPHLTVARSGRVTVGRPAAVGLRSERITLTERAGAAVAADAGLNVLRAKIRQRSCTGARFEYGLTVADLHLHAECADRFDGHEPDLIVRPEDCLLHPAE